MTRDDLDKLGSRLDLGPFLVRHGLTGHGVEIGTYRGDYALEILRKWPGRLDCIDPWENLPDEEYLDGCNRGVPMEEVFTDASVRLAEFAGRVILLGARSSEVVGGYADESLDFVYIDGNHDFAHALADFENYWPKVRPGGIVGLHDCYNRNDDAQRCGVWDVVWMSARALSQKPHLTHCTSAWFVKQ